MEILSSIWLLYDLSIIIVIVLLLLEHVIVWELETFYAASLQEEAQRMYSTYFVAYLKMLIGRLSEMDDLINLKKLMKEEENRE